MPSPLRGLLSAFEEVAQQVPVFDGTADKYVGDGFEAVFVV